MHRWTRVHHTCAGHHSAFTQMPRRIIHLASDTAAGTMMAPAATLRCEVNATSSSSGRHNSGWYGNLIMSLLRLEILVFKRTSGMISTWSFFVRRVAKLRSLIRMMILSMLNDRSRSWNLGLEKVLPFPSAAGALSICFTAQTLIFFFFTSQTALEGHHIIRLIPREPL